MSDAVTSLDPDFCQQTFKARAVFRAIYVQHQIQLLAFCANRFYNSRLHSSIFGFVLVIAGVLWLVQLLALSLPCLAKARLP
jgi:low temperature requirement protein LtrA